MLTSDMDVNFNKFKRFFFNSRMHSIYIKYVKAAGKSHIQVLNRSSKAGAALVKTMAS